MSLFDSLNLGSLKRKAEKAVKDAVQDAVKDVVNQAKNESHTFTFQTLPETLDELKALPEARLDTPFKTAALTICALCAYANSPEVGIDMLNFLKGPQPLSNRELQFLQDAFKDKKSVPFSYFKGAVPSNNYTPDKPYSVTFHTNPYSYQSEGYCMLHVKSGGADSERQVNLRKKGDQWFLWEHQQVMVGIRKSASEDPWA